MQRHKINEKVKVVLLCGGKGERLYPLTNDIPKLSQLDGYKK